MKCSICYGMCTESDTRCPNCGAGLRWGGGVAGSRLPKVLATIGMMVGGLLAPYALGSAKSAPKKGIDLRKATHAGIGGATGGTLGMAMGLALAGGRRYD